ncbi:phospholipase A2 inhibitor NAI-like [Aquarana catesbeiana]|uniref:phospholipase A2 inhibitor NAI-like n=1 Tax=Aquarana catesbeiana TaxID=8400 RepID=UPI003CC9AADD
MDSLLAVVCLISGLVTQGYAISCTQCSSKSSPVCSGYSATCASKLVCISIYQVTSLGGQQSINFVRGCGEKSNCRQSGVFAAPSGKYRFSSTCCESNSCTPSTPVLPPLNFTSNGQSCPFCVSTTSKDCKSDQMMSCMGDEDTCALENTEETVGSSTYKSSMRGCATKGFCNLGTQKSESAGYKSKMVVTCGASTALYSTLTLLILATFSLISNVF